MAKLIITILAGGLGKRMNSTFPKVLHLIFDKPMLVHVIEQARELRPNKIFVIVGKYKDVIISMLKQFIAIDDLEFVLQPEPLGTGHAIQCCKPYLENCEDSTTIILSGDVPLIQSSTISDLLQSCSAISMITTHLKDPKGYGRIIENNGQFVKIVEEKDCSAEEKLVQKVNCGIYAINTNLICKYINNLTNNNSQKEYYLTDIIEIIKNDEQINVNTYDIPAEKQHEIMGVNTLEQLRDLELTKIN
jgi:UDP-N-acetylglucosamine diphosphorylase/glucosamine-1-phosphate N-acetyltransferase